MNKQTEALGNDLYRSKYSPVTEHNGIKMTLIGNWIDLAAYYSGSDGNVWVWSFCTSGWSNEGPESEFRVTFDKRRRGKLFA